MSEAPAWGLPDPWRTVARSTFAEPLSYRTELVQLVVVAAYAVLAGAAAGVVWGNVGLQAPITHHNGVVRYPDNFPNSTKYFLDNDLRFALVALIGGLLVAVVLAILSRGSWLGPGAVVGLAGGGLLAALVAAHVGHQIGSHALSSQIYRWAPGADPTKVRVAVGALDFKDRWHVGLLAWPFASVGVLIGVVALGADRRRRR